MRESDLSAELERRIEAYCSQEIGGEDYPEEVREELRAHFRDRVLGYLNREDDLSESDAFVLAREHFGNPAVVREMLLKESSTGFPAGLYRRMAAGAVVFVLVQPLAGLLVTQTLSLFLDPAKLSPIDTGWAFTATALVTIPLAYAPLRYWRGRLDSGAAPWFMTWPPIALVALLAGIYIAVGAMQLYFSEPGAEQPMLDAMAGFLGVAIMLIQSAQWFWWCRIPPRSFSHFLHAVLGLACYGWPLYTMVMAGAQGANALGTVLVAIPLFILQSAVFGLLFLGMRRASAVFSR